MNYLFGYDVPNWAYYWQAVAMKKYFPKDNENIKLHGLRPVPSKINPDLLFLMEFPRVVEFAKYGINKRKTTTVSYFSVGWGHHLDWLEKITKICNHIVINNYTCWDKFGRKPGTIYIPNGVDFDLFNVTDDITKRKPKIIWIGSTKWHKCKNYDTILKPLAQKLKLSGVDCEFISTTETGKVMNRAELKKWYNNGTVYCCASSTEGTPNPALEAAACGCTVVSTRVGNMPELIQNGVNGYLCDTDVDALYEGCMKAIGDTKLNINMQKEIVKWDWKDRTREYYDYFQKCIQEDRS